jgi:MFS family permease
MTASEARASRPLDAFRAVLRNPGLRRLQLAWAGSNLGTWGYGIALSVFAYDQGGATAVGVVGLVRLIPAAVAAPFMGVLGDRYPRRLVMALSDLGRVLVVGMGAVAIWMNLSPVIVYLLAAVGVVISTAFRPAQAAIIPSLANTPEELTASNVVSSSIESLGMFAGPAVGGVVLAVSGPAAVFALAAATFLWSAVLILRIQVDHDGRAAREDGEVPPSFLRQAVTGFGTVARESAPRLLVGLFTAQALIAGALLVFEVVVALELLGKGDAWVGVLSAAFGVGALLGALLSGLLVTRGRLAVDFGVGILLWGLPLILIGLWPYPAVAVGTMALLGVGNTLVDVSGMTLLQRSVPDDVLARVFAVLETMFMASVALGAILAPAAVHLVGSRTALVITGLFLPVVIALTARQLLHLDATTRAPEREIALLRGIGLFAALPRPTLEHLAGRMETVSVPAGTPIFEQGDPGDRFYVVAQGQVEITRDGAPVAEILPGGYFGEIALLHDVPRQAATSAIKDSELLTLDGEDFVAAVTGYATSQEAAEAVIRSYGPGIGLPV